MKKLCIIALCALFAVSGCSSAPSKDTVEPITTETVATPLPDVTIEVPVSLLETLDTTAEDFVDSIKTDTDSEGVKSADILDDGSVRIVIEGEAHKEMIAELGKSLDEQLQEIVEDVETYQNITAIDHNDTYTEFKVTLANDQVGLNESILVLGFYMYSGFYNIFNGTVIESITVTFLDPEGNVIESMTQPEPTE